VERPRRRRGGGGARGPDRKGGRSELRVSVAAEMAGWRRRRETRCGVRGLGLGGLRRRERRIEAGDFFIFLFFIFVFYKNIFLFSKLTEIYPGRPAAGWPGPGRPAAGRQGFLCKNFCENICAQVSGGRSPGSGAAGPGVRPATRG